MNQTNFLSNCSETFPLQRNFPTSKETFQLRSVLFNFAWLFQTSAKRSNFWLSNLKQSNFSFFPTALSNYTHSGLVCAGQNFVHGSLSFQSEFLKKVSKRLPWNGMLRWSFSPIGTLILLLRWRGTLILGSSIDSAQQIGPTVTHFDLPAAF